MNTDKSFKSGILERMQLREKGIKIDSPTAAIPITEARKSALAIRPGRAKSFGAALTNRLTGDWTMSPLSADAELRNSFRQLRMRSRELERNDPFAENFLRLAENNVVGHAGIGLQMAVKAPESTEEKPVFDRVANVKIETAWKEFSRKANFTVQRTLSATKAAKLILRTVLRDSDCLIRKIRGYPNQFGFSLQLFESDYLDETYNDWRYLSNGNEVRMGVELDATWKFPVAYWLLAAHPGDLYYGGVYSQARVRVPVDEIIHPYLIKRIHQSRGIPAMVAAMLRLQMLNGYDEAELVAARAAAQKMGFIEKDIPESLADQYFNPDSQAAEIRSEPGEIEELPMGTRFKEWDPKHPNQAYPDFTKAQLRGVAAGMGVSYTALANDIENVNFSSIRAGLLEEREVWKSLQTFMIEDVMQEIFEPWLEMALLTGQIDLPFARLNDFTAEGAVIWKPRRWPWVDPLKDVEANVAAIEAKLTTRSRVIADQSNTDFEDTVDELVHEKDYLVQRGLDPALAETPKIVDPTFTAENPGDEGAGATPPKKPAMPNKSLNATSSAAPLIQTTIPIALVIRHGKTDFNGDGQSPDRIRGHKDVPLSDEGRKQAENLGEKLKGSGIKSIFTSDLSRAADTANIIASKIEGGANVFSREELRPWKFGPAIEGQPTAQVQPKIDNLVENPDKVPKGGESFNQFKDRFLSSFKSIRAAYRYEPIAIVTHYRGIKLLQASGHGTRDVDRTAFNDHTDPLQPGEFLRLDVNGIPPEKTNSAQVININVDAKAPTKRKFEIARADGTKISGSLVDEE